MIDRVDHLIVGGGLAGAKCAAKLRENDPNASILIVGGERYIPYNRPPLSKGVLLGYTKPDQIFVYEDSFYADRRIDLITGNPAVGCEPATKTVRLSDGGSVGYGKLLIATGTAPRRLDCGGADLGDILYLRTLDDCLDILKAATEGRKVVVVGGGFIGMELAAAFATIGLDTTMLVREGGLMTKLSSAPVSSFFTKYFADRGVRLILNDSVDRFSGDESLDEVHTQGGLDLKADFAAVGIGVMPNVSWLKGSGLEVDRGLVVDRFLRTADPDIFAAGDMAVYYDQIFERMRRVEHWDNAIRQGELAALNMLGHKKPFDQVAYFFSDMFDLSWEWMGDNTDADTTVARGDIGEDYFILFYLKGPVLRAVFMIGSEPQERSWIRSQIVNRSDLSGRIDFLKDTSVPLTDIVA